MHLEAGKHSLRGLPKAELPNAWTELKAKWFLIAPLGVLVYLLFTGYTPLFAGAVGLSLTVALILGTAIAAGLAVPALRIAFWVGLALVSLVVAVRVAGAGSAAAARAVGRWSTAADVVAYAVYSMAFGHRPGAGTLYGAFVLVVGPLRYGPAGILATVVPVGVTAALWPQLDVTSSSPGTGQVAALCAIFTLPTIVVRSVVMRSGDRLRQAEQQFTTAFEHASIGMAITDLELRVVRANRALGVLLGQTPAQLQGCALDGSVDPLERASMRRALRGLTPTSPSVPRNGGSPSRTTGACGRSRTPFPRRTPVRACRARRRFRLRAVR